jgi:lipid-A-disaccharide synthase
VAGETVVRELIQDEANPAAIAAEVGKLLTDHQYHSAIVEKLGKVRSKLGCGGASANVAGLALTLCKRNDDTTTTHHGLPQ